VGRVGTVLVESAEIAIGTKDNVSLVMIEAGYTDPEWHGNGLLAVNARHSGDVLVANLYRSFSVVTLVSCNGFGVNPVSNTQQPCGTMESFPRGCIQ